MDREQEERLADDEAERFAVLLGICLIGFAADLVAKRAGIVADRADHLLGRHSGRKYGDRTLWYSPRRPKR